MSTWHRFAKILLVLLCSTSQKVALGQPHDNLPQIQILESRSAGRTEEELKFTPGIVISAIVRFDGGSDDTSLLVQQGIDQYFLEAGLVASIKRSEVSRDYLDSLRSENKQYRLWETSDLIHCMKGSYLRKGHALMVKDGSLWLVDEKTKQKLIPLMHRLVMKGLNIGDRFVPQVIETDYSRLTSPGVQSPEEKAIYLLSGAYELGFAGLEPTHFYNLRTGGQPR